MKKNRYSWYGRHMWLGGFLVGSGLCFITPPQVYLIVMMIIIAALTISLYMEHKRIEKEFRQDMESLGLLKYLNGEDDDN